MTLAIPVPFLLAIGHYDSGAIFPMKPSELKPLQSAIWVYDSGTVFSVFVTTLIGNDIPSVFKLTSSIEKGGDCFPDI